jgi:hypothetical protein
VSLLQNQSQPLDILAKSLSFSLLNSNLSINKSFINRVALFSTLQHSTGTLKASLIIIEFPHKFALALTSSSAMNTSHINKRMSIALWSFFFSLSLTHWRKRKCRPWREKKPFWTFTFSAYLIKQISHRNINLLSKHPERAVQKEPLSRYCLSLNSISSSLGLVFAFLHHDPIYKMLMFISILHGGYLSHSFHSSHDDNDENAIRQVEISLL